MVQCWLGSWLKCNFWPVLRHLPQVYFPFTGLDATWVSSIKTVDWGHIQSSEWEPTWVSFIWTPEFSLYLICSLHWISTGRWLRWWNTVDWAIFSESVQIWPLVQLAKISFLLIFQSRLATPPQSRQRKQFLAWGVASRGRKILEEKFWAK